MHKSFREIFREMKNASFFYWYIYIRLTAHRSPKMVASKQDVVMALNRDAEVIIIIIKNWFLYIKSSETKKFQYYFQWQKCRNIVKLILSISSVQFATIAGRGQWIVRINILNECQTVICERGAASVSSMWMRGNHVLSTSTKKSPGIGTKIVIAGC